MLYSIEVRLIFILLVKKHMYNLKIYNKQHGLHMILVMIGMGSDFRIAFFVNSLCANGVPAVPNSPI